MLNKLFEMNVIRVTQVSCKEYYELPVCLISRKKSLQQIEPFTRGYEMYASWAIELNDKTTVH